MKPENVSSYRPHQRETDKSIIKSLWEKYAAVFHLVSFIIIAVFMTGIYWSKYQAQAEDVIDLKIRMTKQELVAVQVLQSLDDIKDYLHVPQKR